MGKNSENKKEKKKLRSKSGENATKKNTKVQNKNGKKKRCAQRISVLANSKPNTATWLPSLSPSPRRERDARHKTNVFDHRKKKKDHKQISVHPYSLFFFALCCCSCCCRRWSMRFRKQKKFSIKEKTSEEANNNQKKNLGINTT